ncbi:TetR/AcrR family transcriptional regulator [Nocardia cyriacigeorgica]|uniref:TetR/AcrR family transcriptional regulator n=2 Tax=Nocardia cyriacigeorgica TaxID=135487 RepID=A0A6P1D5E9_9NOCA|nr:TetR/AcrR family transcriptional regulator [Nocardia cyriacigeorgica]NEW44123.1 TetR/AcrR family transcriptional regulator [Nocardia cyriacigeorgica]NEW52320.1 TetR/AcrR family transcriptional regulator [Nocardia cyriacigeorgica]NEW56306.1 TetR/AcrR family transcriptional regulator [Nocardia cyriacigeorgica]
MSASERGEQVLAAAIEAFAETGYAATKTDDIARRAGVSQPYVIRLFGTKQQLFLAALNRVCDRIETVFREAAADAPNPTVATLGHGYKVFLADRALLQLLLHGFAASADPVIGEQTRARYGQIYALAGELTGATTTELRRFMSTGMLLTVMTSMQVVGPNAVPTVWAEDILCDLEESGD